MLILKVDRFLLASSSVVLKWTETNWSRRAGAGLGYIERERERVVFYRVVVGGVL